MVFQIWLYFNFVTGKKEDFQAKYSILLRQFDEELNMAKVIYDNSYEDPPLHKNQPPTAGRLKWANELLRRIQVFYNKIVSSDFLPMIKDHPLSNKFLTGNLIFILRTHVISLPCSTTRRSRLRMRKLSSVNMTKWSHWLKTLNSKRTEPGPAELMTIVNSTYLRKDWIYKNLQNTHFRFLYIILYFKFLQTKIIFNSLLSIAMKKQNWSRSISTPD